MIHPGPGWLIVRAVETEERFAGSRLIIPDSARDGVARWQAEVVSVGEGGWLDDDAAWAQPDPTGGRFVRESLVGRQWFWQKRVSRHLVPGAWVLLEPRGKLALPGSLTEWLVSQDSVWAVLG